MKRIKWNTIITTTSDATDVEVNDVLYMNIYAY